MDLADVRAVDLTSQELVRMPFVSIGSISLTLEDIQKGVRTVDMDRGQVVKVRVADSLGKPVPSAEIELVLVGRTICINTREESSCLLVCPREPFGLLIKGRLETLVDLPVIPSDQVRTVTLTVPRSDSPGI